MDPSLPSIVPKVPATSSISNSFLRRVARSGMWNVMGFLGASISAFVISIVVARSTDAAGLGRFTYYTWLMRVIGAIVGLGLPAALARFIPEFIAAGREGKARGVLRLSGALATLLSSLAFLGIFVIATQRKEGLAFAVAVGIGAAGTLVVNLLEGFLQGVLKFKQIARVVAIVGILQMALIITGARLGVGAKGLLMIFSLTNVAFAALLYIPVAASKRGWPKEHLQPRQRNRVLRFALILSVVAVIDEVVWGRPEIFFLEHFRSASEVGFYAVGLKFASLVVILPAVISKSLLPEFSSMHGANRTEEFEATFPVLCTVIAYVAIGLSILGAAMADLMVPVIYSEGFRPAILATQVLLAGSVFGGLAGPVAAALFAGSRERFFVQFGILLVTINLILDVLLIPTFGLLGASIATISSQTIGASIGYFLTVKRADLPYPTVDVARLMLMALLAGGVGRAAAELFSGATALVAGGAIATLVYVALADRSKLVTFSQLRMIARR